MIKNIINNAVQSNSRLLDESKDKVISIAKKRAEEQYGDKIPTPTDLKNELESYRAEIVTPANVIKAEQKFNKFISLCDKTISKLDSGIKELNAIKGKVDKINENFAKVNNRIESLNEIVQKLNILVNALPFTLLALNSFTGINGKTIKDLSDLIDSAKDKIKEFSSLTSGISYVSSYYIKEGNKIRNPILKGIDGLTKAKTAIELLKETLIKIFASFIASLNFPEYDEYTDEEMEDVINENLEENGESTIVDDLDNIPEDTIVTFGVNTGKIFVVKTQGGIATEYRYDVRT